jgi:hypothetical protein
VNWGGWDLYGLSQSCDYIFIMGYAFYGSWSTTSGPCSPLTGGSYNITDTVLDQYGAVTSSHPERLILGVPYYGNRWQTVDQQPRSNAVEFIESPRFHTAMAEIETYALRWETASKTPWYRYQTGQDWYQVWFDNDSSLGLKYQLAQDHFLQGVGMWALGYDGSRTELWEELQNRFAPGNLFPPPQPEAPFVHQGSTDDQIIVEFIPDTEADGYWIYFSQTGVEPEDSVFTTGSPAIIEGLQPETLYFFKIRGFNEAGYGKMSTLLAATTASELSKVLVVNGFDRTSGTNNNFEYVRQHANSFKDLDIEISSAENEAIIEGITDLKDFKIVDWILGDESTEDKTFSIAEREPLSIFLENGGRAFISGAEIGWDLVEHGNVEEAEFYNTLLKADFISDAPRNESSTYYQAE